MPKGAKVNDDQAATVRQEWETPSLLFDGLNLQFGFNTDACALAHNAKLPVFWTPEQDGLKQPWAGRRVWCNPVYKDIDPWLAKAAEAELAVYLLPARTDTEWFERYAPKAARVDFFRGRVQFRTPLGLSRIDPKTGKKRSDANAEGSCLLVFDKGKGPRPMGFRDPIIGWPNGDAVLIYPGGMMGLTTCPICGNSLAASAQWSSLARAYVHHACLLEFVKAMAALPPGKQRTFEAQIRGQA